MKWSFKRGNLVLLSVGIGGILAALVACSSAPTTSSPRSTASVASPTPSEISSAPTPVDRIVVRPTGIDLVAAGTVRNSLLYTESADAFASELAAVIGSSATETFRASTDYREADSTLYEWPGLTLVDEHLKEGGPGPSPHGPPTLSLRATEPFVGNGIEVRTVQGIKPGDSVASAAATLGVDPVGSPFFSVPAETGPQLGPSHVDGFANADAVGVSETPANSDAVEIHAPYNFGDGHDI